MVKLKKLSKQVIVITGATSGIGLTTARMAARHGARLVLAARNEAALKKLAAELAADGADVLVVAADVGRQDDVERLGQGAIDHYGQIDTWVNNAGVSIYGRIEDVPLEDMRQLFQTNFWGVLHGSLEAIRRMRKNGGALINLGSEASDRAIPLQGLYSASKHAVKGFTDSLRMEVEKEQLPLSVTLIKPAGIDTMFTRHARNYMRHEPSLPPPVYAPELVANAILYAAQHPQRDVFVGAASKMMSLGGQHTPRLLDRYMTATMFRQQQTDELAAPDRTDSLYEPNGYALQQRLGNQESKVRERSPYTAAALRSRPIALSLLLGGAAYAAWKLGGGRAGATGMRESQP